MARYISLLSLTWRKPPRESGQTVMVAALLLPILMGMAGLAVDVGGYASDRRQLQNAADSIALAAARDLPDATAATRSAQSWAAKDGVSWSDVTVTVTPQGNGNANPKVSVDIARPHRFSFMQVLGIRSRSVGAHAAAIKTSPGGLGDLMPWSVLQSAVQGTPYGQSMIMKYDRNNVTNGNFGPLQFDGTGGSVYQDTIEHGSTSVVCAQGVPNCTTVSPECSGSTCPTEPGNMIGPTREGVNERISETGASCDTFAEVFSGPVDGKYQLNPQCNPWLAGSKHSERVIIVPIISSLCNGQCDVTVLGFTLLFLEGYGPDGCTGSDCEIKGRIVNADVTVNALTGVYDPNSSIHFTRLSE